MPELSEYLVMRKLIVLLLVIQLSLITTPVEAGRDNLYTAVTDVKLDTIVPVVPHTWYTISYGYEIWSERVSDQRPEFLDIEDDTCLVNLTITTTTDIESCTYCLLNSQPPNGNYGGTVYNSGITETYFVISSSLYREGLYVSENDNNVSNYPDGNITFSFDIVEPAVSGIFGEMYGFTIVSENKSNLIVYDDVPDNYGEKTDKQRDFFHLRLNDVRFKGINPKNITFTSFNFNILSEVLNAGSTFSQEFADSGTEYLSGTVSLDGVVAYGLGPGLVKDMLTGKSYPSERRVQHSNNIRISVSDQITAILPDGNITLWFSTNQPDNNTYYAYIRSHHGEITIEYDIRPSFWNDYSLYDVSGNEIRTPWYTLSLLILLPIAMIFKNKQKK